MPTGSTTRRTLLLPFALCVALITLATPATGVASWKQAPIVPTFTADTKTQLLADIRAGQRQGLRPNAFAKVGDSNTMMKRTLYGLGCRTAASLPADVQPTVSRYSATVPNPYGFPDCKPANSFSRVSAATRGGTLSNWSVRTIADLSQYGGFWAPPPGCSAATTPLKCEIAALKPRYLLIMTGTNDIGYYLDKNLAPAPYISQGLTQIIQTARQHGAVPILSTLPPIRTYGTVPQSQFNTHLDATNATIWTLARNQRVPLINLWRALTEPQMINQGLSIDGLHLDSYPGNPPATGATFEQTLLANSVNFTTAALRYGANRRNLILLRTLATIDNIAKSAGLAGSSETQPVLPKNNTTSQLKRRIASHALKRGLAVPSKIRCSYTPKRVRCTATSITSRPATTIRCNYTATAIQTNTSKGWRTKHQVKARCGSIPKLRLDEADAVSSIGQQGLAQFSKNVTIGELKRTSDTQFTGFVTWTEASPSDPWGPPLLYCRADFSVSRISPSQVLTVFTDDKCSF